MFCTACKEDGVTEKDSVFVKGSAVIRQNGIKKSLYMFLLLFGDFNSAAK